MRVPSKFFLRNTFYVYFSALLIRVRIVPDRRGKNSANVMPSSRLTAGSWLVTFLVVRDRKNAVFV